MHRDETYPNAPLALAALEVRHTLSDPLSEAQWASLKHALSSHTPLMKDAKIREITVDNSQSETDIIKDKTERFTRFLNRNKTLSISIRNNALVIETTDYDQWETFFEVAATALRARQEIGGIDGVERLGLRYVNEIRIPGQVHVDWTSWIHGSLLGAYPLGETVGLKPNRWQGATIFSGQDEQSLVLRYGSLEGVAVMTDGELIPKQSSKGPFFLIDIDSFWEPTQGVPGYDSDDLLSICNRVHEPVRGMFEALVTDRLRSEILRNA